MSADRFIADSQLIGDGADAHPLRKHNHNLDHQHIVRGSVTPRIIGKHQQLGNRVVKQRVKALLMRIARTGFRSANVFLPQAAAYEPRGFTQRA